MAKAKISFVGDEYIVRLESLGANADEYLGKAIYKGAEMMANSVKNALWKLPIDRRGKVDVRRGLHPVQKQGLIESFGIAPIRRDGNFLNVKLGFDGYNEFKTFTYPKGQPNVMIARSLEYGTSYLPPNPIITKTVQRKENDVIEKIEKVLDREIKKIMK